MTEVEKIGDVPIRGLQFEISLDMPGQLLETNSPQKKGSMVVWSFTGRELSEGVTLSAQSRVWNSTAIAGTIGVLVLVAGGIGYVVYRRKLTTSSDDEKNGGVVFD
jgi:hypothetical protein